MPRNTVDIISEAIFRDVDPNWPLLLTWAFVNDAESLASWGVPTSLCRNLRRRLAGRWDLRRVQYDYCDRNNQNILYTSKFAKVTALKVDRRCKWHSVRSCCRSGQGSVKFQQNLPILFFKSFLNWHPLRVRRYDLSCWRNHSRLLLNNWRRCDWANS